LLPAASSSPAASFDSIIRFNAISIGSNSPLDSSSSSSSSSSTLPLSSLSNFNYYSSLVSIIINNKVHVLDCTTSTTTMPSTSSIEQENEQEHIDNSNEELIEFNNANTSNSRLIISLPLSSSAPLHSGLLLHPFNNYTISSSNTKENNNNNSHVNTAIYVHGCEIAIQVLELVNRIKVPIGSNNNNSSSSVFLKDSIELVTWNKTTTIINNKNNTSISKNIKQENNNKQENYNSLGTFNTISILDSNGLVHEIIQDGNGNWTRAVFSTAKLNNDGHSNNGQQYITMKKSPPIVTSNYNKSINYNYYYITSYLYAKQSTKNNSTTSIGVNSKLLTRDTCIDIQGIGACSFIEQDNNNYLLYNSSVVYNSSSTAVVLLCGVEYFNNSKNVITIPKFCTWNIVTVNNTVKLVKLYELELPLSHQSQHQPPSQLYDIPIATEVDNYASIAYVIMRLGAIHIIDLKQRMVLVTVRATSSLNSNVPSTIVKSSSNFDIKPTTSNSKVKRCVTVVDKSGQVWYVGIDEQVLATLRNFKRMYSENLMQTRQYCDVTVQFK